MQLNTKLTKLEKTMVREWRQERSAAARLSALALAALTIFSVSNVVHQRENKVAREVVVPVAVVFEAASPIEHAGENEVARMPVNLEGGLRTQTHSGM